MRLRGIRHRMRGWKLLRNVERIRYRRKVLKIKRKKSCHHKALMIWRCQFDILPGDEKFVSIVSKCDFCFNISISPQSFPKNSLIIKLPEAMDFEEHYDDSSRVISIFRRAIEAGRRIAYIDFSALKEISPACIMVFASYAYLWKKCAPSVRACCDTWTPCVEEAFAQLGVFEALDLRHREKQEHVMKRRYMPLLTRGITSYAGYDVGMETKRIRESIEEFIGQSLNGVQMYGSVTEAIFNVRNHAYKGMIPGRLPFRWWLSVSYDEHNNEVGVILFDYGYGIPATMNRSTKFSKIRKFLRRRDGGWNDASRLYVAFERDRRRINAARPFREGRGHGCQDITRLVLPQDQNRVKSGSRLSVISGKARYDLVGDEGTQRGDVKTVNRKLQGTLIEWRIKL